MDSSSSILIVYEYITRVLNRYVHCMRYISELGTGETKRCLGRNLVARNSIFCWLTSELIKCNKQEINQFF